MRAHLLAPGRHLTGGQKIRLASRAIAGKPQLHRLSKTSRRWIFDPTVELQPGEALGGKVYRGRSRKFRSKKDIQSRSNAAFALVSFQLSPAVKSVTKNILFIIRRANQANDSLFRTTVGEGGLTSLSNLASEEKEWPNLVPKTFPISKEIKCFILHVNSGFYSTCQLRWLKRS